MAFTGYKAMGAIAVVTAASMMLSGCAITPQKAETEAKVEVSPVVPQTESETQTETQTETAKKEVPLKDIQVSIPRTGKKGTVSLQVDGQSGSNDITQSFVSTSGAFQSVSDDGTDGVYAGEDGVLYEKDGAWKETGEEYQGLFPLVYSEDCEKLDDTSIDDTACYHLSVDSDESVSVLTAFCYCQGYTDIVGGSTRADFYVAKETFEIVRVDVSMPFMGTAADGTDTKGEVSGSISVSGTSDEKLEAPEAEQETTEKEQDYTAGELMAEKNGYMNQQFGLQVLGGSLFTFDTDKTQELKDSYTSSGSAYTEEAYGSGDGIILNISSIQSHGSSTEDILQKYLSDSAAENITAGDNVDLAGKTYATAVSTINQTQTKSYATGVDGQVLILTLYYTQDTSIAEFEKNIYSSSENPYWEASSWILESKYQVTTPNGYSIVNSESGELYVCMASSTDEVNVFAMEGSSLEDEIAKETTSEGDTGREVRAQEDITLADGSTMNYYAVLNTEPNLTYYTYVGFIQKDTAVIKFYAVSTADDADYKKVYTEFANGTTVIAADSTTADGAGETLADGTAAAATADAAAETAAQ